MKTTIRLIYTSCAVAELDAPALETILAQAQRNNARDDITGVLLACGSRFLQTLEGPREAVSACYARIAADPRHAGCALLSLTPIERRNFADWSMRLLSVTPTTDAKVAAFFRELDQGETSAGTDRALGLLEQLIVRGKSLTPY